MTQLLLQETVPTLLLIIEICRNYLSDLGKKKPFDVTICKLHVFVVCASLDCIVSIVRRCFLVVCVQFPFLKSEHIAFLNVLFFSGVKRPCFFLWFTTFKDF